MNRRDFISGVLSTLLLSFQTRIIAVEAANMAKYTNKTGLISDSVFLQHHIATGHPETPKRISYIQNTLKESGVLQQVSKIGLKIGDVEEWIKTLHTEGHIASIKKNTPIAHKVAIACVRGCLAAVDRVASKQINNAFCLSRPPGHHALNTGREEGFCYYNTIAIAARYAQKQYGFKKILIIDWDYHHGNATEAMFYDDPSVLYFSTHDQFAYPGTGDPAKKGIGKGLGFNINVHLPCGTDDKKIIDVYKSILLPAAEKFEPDMILISAGFDSREEDLLGCFDITDAAYVTMTKIVMKIAEKHCDGRVVSMLEGGYNLQGIAKAVTVHIKTLLGEV
ncbi:MAG TPA: histone deacetylase [Thiotrichaceae bacterium]|jgi:acetoin utilization deacetylase AcuC-like enzyme|nr:histone deacetylase [Thiotrichaceae bacterium]